MSKTKRASNRSGSEDARTQQPRLLGWLMIVGGAFSTWCWYRPLPDNTDRLLHPSAADGLLSGKSGEIERESEGLVLPSAVLAPSGAQPGLRAIDVNELPPDLVGEGEVALQPYRENRHRELLERVGTEPLPVIPIDGPMVTLGRPNPKPPLWTDGLGTSTRSQLASTSQPGHASSLGPETDSEYDAPSPFRAGVLADSEARSQFASTSNKPWPDEAYRSELNRKLEFRNDRASDSVAASSISDLPGFHRRGTRNAATESVMSLSSNRIRTEEDEPRIQSLPHPGSPPNDVLRPKSIGNVIRQPSVQRRP